MADKTKSREPLPRKPKSVSNAEEKIRLRAYQLYERNRVYMEREATAQKSGKVG